MLRRAALPLALGLAAPVLAEPISDRGYTVGCSDDGCVIQASGFSFFVAYGGGSDEIKDMLVALPPVSAVAFEGEMSNMGDSSADLILSALTPVPDDLYEGNLQAMQGDWTPMGEETPFVVRIAGLDWEEQVNGEFADAFAMSVGEACADGVVPGGMAINLYRYGDDPAADACWQLEYIEGDTMVLRDFKGDQGQVEFSRP